ARGEAGAACAAHPERLAETVDFDGGRSARGDDLPQSPCGVSGNAKRPSGNFRKGVTGAESGRFRCQTNAFVCRAPRLAIWHDGRTTLATGRFMTATIVREPKREGQPFSATFALL